MDKHSPTPWRVWTNRYGQCHILAADDTHVDGPVGPSEPPGVAAANAAFIVEAVNANGAWREERRRLKLAAASAGKAFDCANARRTLLERYYCEVYAERDRLRDLVRRLAEYIRLGHCNEVHIDRADPRQSYHVRAADLLREAEAALAKEAQA